MTLDTLSPEERAERAHILDTRTSPVVRRALTSDHVEVRSAGGFLTFEGLASSTSVRGSDGSLQRDNGYDMGWYTERIIAGAFTDTLRSNPDVSLFINHEGLALARTTNGTLDLRENPDRGLEFVGRASEDDPDAQRLAMKVRSGLADQCSFAFRIEARAWDDDHSNQDITAVNLHRGDVSVVSYGANPATPVGVRSLMAAMAAFADLTDTDLADLRRDPAVMQAARMLLTSAEATESTTLDAPVEPEVARISVDLARARAYALSKKHSR